MGEQVYCYHCRRQHAAAEVMLVEARGVKRWRCRKSIALSQGSSAARDAYGQAVSELNRALSSAHVVRPLPRPVLELFGSSGTGA